MAPVAGIDLDLLLDRCTFEEVTRPLLDHTITLTQALLKKTGAQGEARPRIPATRENPVRRAA